MVPMRFLAVLMVMLLVFSALSIALPAPGRYLVKGDARGLRVQHEFSGGVTAELSSAEALALTLRGVELESVPLWHVLGRQVSASGKGKPGPAARVSFPSDQTPWGMETVYNNASLLSTSGGAGVDVAVLDTGVYKNHLDLSRRVTQCKDFTRGPVKNGCPDGYGHGTHVSGTILADAGADGLGIWGVAPAANLFAYKVCGNDGYCWSDNIATAIRHAADQGAEIISMSLGGDAESALVRDAITYAVGKGVLVVAAAGNDGPALGSIDWPGANANVVAVAAIDSSLAVADWSSRGLNDGDFVIEAQEVEFGAPGVAVESAMNNGGYAIWDGTSMATPHIAGLAAKLWQGSGAATRAYLQGLAVDIDAAGDDPATGFGLARLG
ncbi:S8 family serine peptidase [Candidatus Woesearchaeota archaeon]|nr:S8 family serine peptidase [Candidatus Woesearchaeota archaeon]